ncbi:MAG: hypothetical protein IJ491_00710 [Clostridia bacterium]|nr:hypothetical protein [Clostridia bacterium]
MFATLESFSIFFFTCLALIILGIIFEEKLIALEKRIDKKIAQKKAAKRRAEIRKANLQSRTKRPHTAAKSTKQRIAA